MTNLILYRDFRVEPDEELSEIVLCDHCAESIGGVDLEVFDFVENPENYCCENCFSIGSRSTEPFISWGSLEKAARELLFWIKSEGV